MSSTRAILLAFGALLAGMAVPFVDRISPTVGGMALEPLAAASTVAPVRVADAGRNRTNGVAGGCTNSSGTPAIQTTHRFLVGCKPKDNLAGFCLSHPDPNIESASHQLGDNCQPANLP